MARVRAQALAPVKAWEADGVEKEEWADGPWVLVETAYVQSVEHGHLTREESPAMNRYARNAESPW
jgi:hypothetical protein